jgi:hypothetical protein
MLGHFKGRKVRKATKATLATKGLRESKGFRASKARREIKETKATRESKGFRAFKARRVTRAIKAIRVTLEPQGRTKSPPTLTPTSQASSKALDLRLRKPLQARTTWRLMTLG